jgi:hypothetical protein
VTVFILKERNEVGEGEEGKLNERKMNMGGKK